MRLLIALPAVLREYRSMTKAKYNQPPSVQISVMSEQKTVFRLLTSNHWANRFFATGNL